MKKKRLLWATLCLFILGINLWAQPQNEMRDRASAARAARIDALRQLGESIQGVKISSTTTVKDFVTENDQINADFSSFIKGARQIGEPVYHSDGTCEVTLVINMNDLIYGLKKIHRQNWSETVNNANEFNNLSTYNNQKEFKATGAGAMKQAPTNTYQENVWKYVSARGKLMAVRTARVDAYRNMAEVIKGVRITSSTTVKDFVTESDEIRASFNGFIRGVQFVGRPRYKPQGIVEVTAQVELDKLIDSLADNCRKNYQGNEFNTRSFQGIKSYYPKRTIQAVGVGVPPAKYMRRRPTNPEPFPPYNPDPYIPQPEKPQVPEWANRTVRVTGSGVFPDFISPAEGQVDARRAAVLDGYRLIAEQIMGLRIDSSTTVRNFVMKNDQVSGKVTTFIRGARVVNERNVGDGTYEVNMELYLGDMWQIIQSHSRQ